MQIMTLLTWRDGITARNFIQAKYTWTPPVSWALSWHCSDVTTHLKAFPRRSDLLEQITLGSLGSLLKYKPFSAFLFSCRISVPAHTCLWCNFFPLINPQTLLDTTAVMFAKYCNANGALLISCILTISNISLLSVDFSKVFKAFHCPWTNGHLVKAVRLHFWFGRCCDLTAERRGALVFAFNTPTQPLHSPIPGLASNRNVISFSCAGHKNHPFHSVK